jgi:NAD(P)-dependent dehydrogenase (short-subunit alcohol dehydrogenase family)
LGIRVRIVEPGMIRTNFGGRSFDFAMDEELPEYAPTAAAMGRVFGKLAANPSGPDVVAEVIWQAANESGGRLRYQAGADAEELLERRKRQDDATFIAGTSGLNLRMLCQSPRASNFKPDFPEAVAPPPGPPK